jgi:hypothetical protein
MKIIKNLVVITLLLSVLLANKTKNKSKDHMSHKAKFDKKSNKERYRVESESNV